MKTMLRVFSIVAISCSLANGGDIPTPHSPAGVGPDKVPVIVCETGIVAEPPQWGLCMEKVDYVMHTAESSPRTIQLYPANDEAKKVLDETKGKRTIVTVCGVMLHGAECTSLAVGWAGPPSAMQSKLK